MINYVLNSDLGFDYPVTAIRPEVINRLRRLTRKGGILPHPFERFKVDPSLVPVCCQRKVC